MFKFILILTLIHLTTIAEEKSRPLNDKLQSRKQKANQKKEKNVRPLF